MREVFKNEEVLKNCKIFRMLEAQNARHLSFHTPGHKTAGWDITELSYSDNLSAPDGCIQKAQADIAQILGANTSFLLTDGSTSGVFSMLWAAKTLGVKRLAVCENAHKSVFNACAVLGLAPLVYPQKKRGKIPFAYTMYELNEKFPSLLAQADGLLLTSPDYYGNIADLQGARSYCDKNDKLLLIDGAHGGHLHFDKTRYAGAYADLWVDGVHKSLPALTQGAVVSAKNEKCAQALGEAVDIFRTSSPSYPIMASVEYAVKYPRNEELEKAVLKYVKNESRVYANGDWTKVCALFGDCSWEAYAHFENEGIYPEFCDGNAVLFYLSPATSLQEFARLQESLALAFGKYPYEKGREEREQERVCVEKGAPTEWVDLQNAEGRACALPCGLFPPCTPLIGVGERVSLDTIRRLSSARYIFGVKNGKILVCKEEEKE